MYFKYIDELFNYAIHKYIFNYKYISFLIRFMFMDNQK